MQKIICNHLAKIKDQPQSGFLIGGEVLRNDDSSRYFKISYSETRTDQMFVQITPMRCSREGYLKINVDGTISLTDKHFNFYRSSSIFYFDPTENVLKFRTDTELEMQERTSSKYVKDLLSVGMFALAATALYVVAKDEGIGFKL